MFYVLYRITNWRVEEIAETEVRNPQAPNEDVDVVIVKEYNTS